MSSAIICPSSEMRKLGHPEFGGPAQSHTAPRVSAPNLQTIPASSDLGTTCMFMPIPQMRKWLFREVITQGHVVRHRQN